MLPAYQLPDSTRKWCAFFKWMTAILVLLMIADLVFADVLQRIIEGHYLALSDFARGEVQFSDTKNWLLRGLALISWGSAILILLAGFRLFDTLARGEPFSANVQRAIRLLGAMILLNGALGILMRTIFPVALTYDNPPGHGEVSIAISSAQVNHLIIGAIILILGHIFLQAVRISDENRQIV